MIMVGTAKSLSLHYLLEGIGCTAYLWVTEVVHEQDI